MDYITNLHANTKVKPGQIFGRLTVLGAIRRDRGSTGQSHIIWHCRCECGGEIETRSVNLCTGDTSSCGCFLRERIIASSTTHGHTKNGNSSPEYATWLNMIQRCRNPNASAYNWYGGRGIRVCQRWQRFENFLADMGTKPSLGHTIERDDVNGDYEPKNCRWVPRIEQGRNKRNNRLLTAFGETHHMQEWCRRTGINQRTLWDRLESGWSEERAITTPVKRRA